MTSRHLRRQGEGGAAALSLLVVAMLIGVGIIFAMAIPLTNATDAKAKSRNAADAAALAGVEHVKVGLRDALLSQGWLGSWGDYAITDGGQAQAQRYARENGGTLVAYQPPTLLNGWEAYARVRGRDVEGQPTYSEARAALDLPECRTEEVPPEEDEDEDADADAGESDGDGDGEEEGEEEEEPPPPPTFTLTCGGMDLSDLSLEDVANELVSLVMDANAKLVD